MYFTWRARGSKMDVQDQKLFLTSLISQTYISGKHVTLCGVCTDRPDSSFKQHQVKPLTRYLKVAAMATFYFSKSGNVWSKGKKKSVLEIQ